MTEADSVGSGTTVMVGFGVAGIAGAGVLVRVAVRVGAGDSVFVGSGRSVRVRAAVTVETGDGLGVDVGLGVAVLLGVSEGLRDGIEVAVSVGWGLTVSVEDGVLVTLGEGLGELSGVRDGSGVLVTASDGDEVDVSVRVAVDVLDSVGSGGSVGVALEVTVKDAVAGTSVAVAVRVGEAVDVEVPVVVILSAGITSTVGGVAGSLGSNVLTGEAAGGSGLGVSGVAEAPGKSAAAEAGTVDGTGVRDAGGRTRRGVSVGAGLALASSAGESSALLGEPVAIGDACSVVARSIASSVSTPGLTVTTNSLGCELDWVSSIASRRLPSRAPAATIAFVRFNDSHRSGARVGRRCDHVWCKSAGIP